MIDFSLILDLQKVPFCLSEFSNQQLCLSSQSTNSSASLVGFLANAFYFIWCRLQSSINTKGRSISSFRMALRIVLLLFLWVLEFSFSCLLLQILSSKNLSNWPQISNVIISVSLQISSLFLYYKKLKLVFLIQIATLGQIARLLRRIRLNAECGIEKQDPFCLSFQVLNSYTKIISVFLLNPISSWVYYISYLFPILCCIKDISLLALEIREISSSCIEPSRLILINILI